jgi:hypothetical protein
MAGKAAGEIGERKRVSEKRIFLCGTSRRGGLLTGTEMRSVQQTS